MALALPVSMSATTFVPAVARAADPKKPAKDPPKDPKIAEAKKLFDDGSAAYSDGKYEEAVKAWEQSYELSQKPLIFESIASAYERMGDKKKAREYLAKWREAAPKDEIDQLDARIKNLDARIAAQEKEDAARKEAEEKARREGAGNDADKAAREEAKARDAARSSRMKLAIGVGAAGVVAVGAGVVLDIVAAGQRPDANTACSNVGGKNLCRDSAKGGIESSSTLALVGDITWIAGAVIAAGGVALLVTLPPGGKAPDATKTPGKEGRREPSRWVSVAPFVQPTGGGVGITGRF